MIHRIIIPAHNEEKFIGKTLDSIINQTVIPNEIIVVNDNSTDDTEKIILSYQEKYGFIRLVNNKSSNEHLPGEKIINAFFAGYKKINQPYDIISKIDADMVFPPTYFEETNMAFKQNKQLGICGGIAIIKKNEAWVYENVAHKDHVRGGFKSYRKECFESIGKLKQSMGWDTVDELLAYYHKWEVIVLHHLEVKHLKPTTHNYKSINTKYQAAAFYKMDYGFKISFISILKAAYRKKSIKFIIDGTMGYFSAMKTENKMVSKQEGEFIRSYRWKKILEKIK